MATSSAVSLMDVLFQEISPEELEEIFKPFETAEKGDARDAQDIDVDQFIDGQKKQSTKLSTTRDIRNVQRWLFDNKREPRAIENIPAKHLNDLLSEMFISIRKSDGSNYEPVSLECIKNSIERHLKEKEYQFSLKDKIFQKSMVALNSKKIELKKQGLGRKPNKSFHISPEEENKMYECGALGDGTPKSLITTIFYLFGKMFGFRARDEARQLCFGDIELKETNGEKYLQFYERSTKTRDGSDLKNVRDTLPKIFSSKQNDPKRDPINLYNKFLRKRPLTMLNPDSPFFLTPIPTTRLTGTDEEIWYYPRPMGENTLGNLMKEAASLAKIDKKITNHSVRKTTVTSLSRAGVPPQKIMKITAHKNIQSITHYDDELTENEHKNISNILQGATQKSSSPTLSHVDKQAQAKQPFTQLPQGCVFNNCTFNF